MQCWRPSANSAASSLRGWGGGPSGAAKGGAALWGGGRAGERMVVTVTDPKTGAGRRRLLRTAPKLFAGNITGLDGGCSRIRTYDPLIKSQLLYQLSYAPPKREAPYS